ncbi:MAG: Holliday junction branch migration protein RuvA [Bacteroidia bacterium]|jgi:Holliday junction DNA helicase RuvA
MFEFIEGNIESLSPTHVIIENNGIGYIAQISLNTYEAIKANKQVRLFVEQVFKVENQNPVSTLLFGFAHPEERHMFKMLVSISGVGYNTAIIMLSSLDPNSLTAAIINGNVGLLKSVKGIGEKTAQRIILELKSKLNTVGGTLSSNLSGGASDNVTEALTALTVLGYPKTAAEKAILKISKELGGVATVEELIKNSLKIL